MRPVTDTELLKAAPFIAESLKRSPCGNTLEDVLLAIAQGDARLWLGQQSAAVSQFVSTARITADERVWHAGGDMADLMRVLEGGAKLCAAVGCDRIVIEDTRRGWAKALRPHGFEPVQNVLVRELS